VNLKQQNFFFCCKAQFYVSPTNPNLVTGSVKLHLHYVAFVLG